MNVDDDIAEGPPEFGQSPQRSGQELEGQVPVVHSGLPPNSYVLSLPEILLEGSREKRHTDLTWKLISKMASDCEEDKRSLRADLAIVRADLEGWRTTTATRSEELIDLRARWDSVSKLVNVQALLYVVGGLLVGPAIQGLLSRSYETADVMLAVLGTAAIISAFLLGRIGPKRRP